MRPIADYVCLSKKCETPEGEAPEYELPIDSKVCPKCGSKRIKRLFNKVNIPRGAPPDRDPRLTSNSHAVRSGALLRSGFDYHDAHKPGYTPLVDGDGYRVNDPNPYDKLRSFDAEAPEMKFMQPIVKSIRATGKGAPLTTAEITQAMRGKPEQRDPAVAGIAAVSRRRVPTNVVARYDPPAAAAE